MTAATGTLLVAAVIVPLAAYAVDGPYDIDGVVPGTPPPVVTQLEDPEGNVKELGPLNSNTTKIGSIHGDALPTLGLTNPNGQVDLRQAWVDTEREGTKDWLYFGWERDANSGSGFIAYEFMQLKPPDACVYGTPLDATALIESCNPWDYRKAGDFMILWDQQGGSKDLYLRTWSGAGDNLTLSPPGTPLTASVSEAEYSTDGFSGEAAINLTDTIFGGSTACRTFANTIPSTVTGNSDTADYKDTILATTPPISNCTSTTVTTPQVVTNASTTPVTTASVSTTPGVSIGTGVVAVRDSAIVSLTGGTATPAGSVAFFLCKLNAGQCTGVNDPNDPLTDRVGTSVGFTNLSGSYPVTVQSRTAYVTSAGRYCWRAVYSGDTANGIPGSSDSSATECFTVNPVTPTLSTSAGLDVNLGTAVTDSALLGGTATQPANPIINLIGTGGAAAGGMITFELYGPSNTVPATCGALVHTSATVPVSGNGTYNTPAPQYVPQAAGDYHWVAVYSGNSPNTLGKTHNAACTDTAEDVTVTSVPSSMTTAQSWVPNDSATISAASGTGNLAGSVSFTLYSTINCTGTALFGPVTRTVAGAASGVTVSTLNTTAVTASGSFSWKVSYDSTNTAQEDISPKCQETSALTVTNGGTETSP